MLNQVASLTSGFTKKYPKLHEFLIDSKDRIRGCSPEDRKRLFLDRAVITLEPEGKPKGNALVSLLVEPFLIKKEEDIPHNHTNFWENYQIACAFRNLGLCVDVIRWTNRKFIPQKDYHVFIDYRYNLERLAPYLNRDCIKVMHADAAHWLFHMKSQYKRLFDLQKRRGVSIKPHKILAPNYGIEAADCAIVLGNQFTLKTFEYAEKKLFRVPISSPIKWPWPEKKDFNTAKGRFLWFGSAGLVHKGLDLVLEAFKDMPEYYLTVCGPVSKEKTNPEKEFIREYHKELFETKNIETYGWIEIASKEFIDIANSSVAVVFPSCSEGGGGGIITCMDAGLIPIVTYEASVEIGDFGVRIEDASIEGIKRAVRYTANLPENELEVKSKKAWMYAKENHTKDKFKENIKAVAEKIVARDF